MIYLLTNSGDSCVTEVQKWLSYFEFKSVRINENAFSDYVSSIKTTASSNVFYLRRNFSEAISTRYSEQEKDQKVLKHLSEEANELKSFFLSQAKYVLGGPGRTSRLENLKIAHSIGMTIPRFYVVSSKHDVLAIIGHNGFSKYVTKPISYPIKVKFGDSLYSAYTEIMTKEIFELLPEHFFPSLLMKKIEKVFEIRIFFLAGEFYKMAIWSQEDKQTAVDFRRYNFDKPNRTVPFKLPSHVQIRIEKLMECLNLNTGSIDMILDKYGRYVFLEVNPEGQFGMVSTPCNYYLHREIAKKLINEECT